MGAPKFERARTMQLWQNSVFFSAPPANLHDFIYSKPLFSGLTVARAGGLAFTGNAMITTSISVMTGLGVPVALRKCGGSRGENECGDEGESGLGQH
jgi:hypothetical protein